ncbi:uncharacterized protein [Pyrus communis]|uniref:uncharacterized protein n=1 Tax=Pyrus communis TaxID=23211 RepID=UPI0035C07639
MTMVLRYVNKEGEVIERFLGVQQVSSTTSSSLEEAIERLFASTNLSMSKLRGQGYEGASNMKGELNGLKAKILNKYPLAFYVRYFAHQLQLALVAIAKGIEGVTIFFNNASILVNTIGSSCKKALDIGDLETVCKQRLQSLRDDDFGDLLDDVQKFCQEHDIDIPNMENLHFVPGKSRHKAPRLTNFHYCRVDLYFQVLDTQLKELNDRFNEMHSEFSSLRGIGNLAKELVKTGRYASYMLVYKLLTLALVLPVVTALVERAFSAMKIVKTPLCNKMEDQWLSDSMLVYIERDVFAFIDNKPIMRRFHDMKPHQQQL